MYNVAFVILYVKGEDAMGIGPKEFSHGRVFQDHPLGHVVGHISVMCERRAIHHQKAHGQDKTYC
jgi:hypothetical protein